MHDLVVIFSLKQKFQKTFEDVCLYSEISYLLSTYNYRLKARRFIQELFQDIKFQAVSSQWKPAFRYLPSSLYCIGRFCFQLHQVSKELHERLRAHLLQAQVSPHLFSEGDASERASDTFSSFNDPDVALSKVEESSAEKPQDSCI